MRRSTATILLVAGLFAPCAAIAQIMTAAPTYFEAGGKLTPSEMQATFSGKYHEEGTDTGGHDWSIDASSDGTLHVSAGAYTDTGRARLDGARLCVTYRKAWKGAERCYTYAHHGRQLASYGPDGKLESVVTVGR
jgi:hypothetical protein